MYVHYHYTVQRNIVSQKCFNVKIAGSKEQAVGDLIPINISFSSIRWPNVGEEVNEMPKFMKKPIDKKQRWLSSIFF